MNILGATGQIYMFVLLVLLFLGSGFAVWRFINFLMEKGAAKSGSGEKTKQNEQVKEKISQESKVKGGFIMANNGFIKLAIVSFVGIIVSVAILGFTSTGYSQSMNMNGQGMNMNSQSMYGNTYMQGGMNMNTPMGYTQMQGNMNMNGNMMQNDYTMMQQQLYQMQMQLNQVRQQMQMMNGNMGGYTQMQQGNMNNMGGMGMMNGMMGGMSNMQQNNMNNMNNMQQNNMNNMQQQNSNNNSSSGGMSMM